MKKTLILSLALAAAMPAMADLQGNGYYRVQNMVTDRYVSVVDNRGSIDFVATSADLQAITLQRDFNAVSSDVATVLYIEKKGSEYNISAQGTSIYSIIDHYVTLMENGSSNGRKLYMAYGTYDGVTRFLGDGNTMGGDLGEMSVTCTGNYRKWYVEPISADSDNYLGAVPVADATAGEYPGKYTTIYAAFPFSTYSEGMKFYTVDKFGEWGQVTLKEVTGVVPAGTPVIVKCVGNKSKDNRLNVGGEGTSPGGNGNLKGVYFNCGKGGHINRVQYDRATMRVLGVCADGRLGFVQANLDYIPANTAYLKVPEGSPAEFPCVHEDDFSGVEEIGADSASRNVYTVTGLDLGVMSRDEIRALPAGMYIVGSRKIVVR